MGRVGETEDDCVGGVSSFTDGGVVEVMSLHFLWCCGGGGGVFSSDAQ